MPRLRVSIRVLKLVRQLCDKMVGTPADRYRQVGHRGFKNSLAKSSITSTQILIKWIDQERYIFQIELVDKIQTTDWHNPSTLIIIGNNHIILIIIKFGSMNVI